MSPDSETTPTPTRTDHGGVGTGGNDDPRRDPNDDTGASTGPRGREVVVPMGLYKTVTVFSTLFAVAGVVLGFVLLDAATNRARASLGEIDAVLAVAGLSSIGLAALVYAFATRFRASGMGRSKPDGGQGRGDG